MKPENETDRNKVMETLKRSDLEEKINRYENKIDTTLLRIIDPKGVDFSGGERQRLAIDVYKRQVHNQELINFLEQALFHQE